MKSGIVVGAALAVALVGCTQETGSWSVESSSKTAQELNAVQSCASQDESCVKMAVQMDASASALASCEQTLRSCLDALINQAISEAGVPPIPSFDAGVPSIPGFDAGVPSIPSFDGGVVVPPIPDAGLPQVPSFDGGFPGSDCISQLQMCLASSTNPATCATQVATCLKNAI